MADGHDVAIVKDDPVGGGTGGGAAVGGVLMVHIIVQVFVIAPEVVHVAGAGTAGDRQRIRAEDAVLVEIALACIGFRHAAVEHLGCIEIQVHCGDLAVVRRGFGNLIHIQAVQGQVKVRHLHLPQGHHAARGLQELGIMGNGQINGNGIVDIFLFLHRHGAGGGLVPGGGGDDSGSFRPGGDHAVFIHGGHRFVGGSPCDSLVGGIVGSNSCRQIQELARLQGGFRLIQGDIGHCDGGVDRHGALGAVTADGDGDDGGTGCFGGDDAVFHSGHGFIGGEPHRQVGGVGRLSGGSEGHSFVHTQLQGTLIHGYAGGGDGGGVNFQGDLGQCAQIHSGGRCSGCHTGAVIAHISVAADFFAAKTACVDIAIERKGFRRPIRRDLNGKHLGGAAEIVAAKSGTAAVLISVAVLVKIGQLPVEVIGSCQLLSGTGQTGDGNGDRIAGIQLGVFINGISFSILDFHGHLLRSDHLIGVNTILFNTDDVATGGQTGNRNGAVLSDSHAVRGKLAKGQCFRTHGAAVYGDGAAVLRLEADRRASGAGVELGRMLGIKGFAVAGHIGGNTGAVLANADHEYTGAVRPDSGQTICSTGTAATTGGSQLTVHGIVGYQHNDSALVLCGQQCHC